VSIVIEYQHLLHGVTVVRKGAAVLIFFYSLAFPSRPGDGGKRDGLRQLLRIFPAALPCTFPRSGLKQLSQYFRLNYQVRASQLEPIIRVEV
jgi:hypothetical protein